MLLKLYSTQSKQSENDIDINIKKEDGFFKIIIDLSELSPKNVLEIREDGLYLENGTDIVKLVSKKVFHKCS